MIETIGIVILNYLNWEDTKELLESLESQTYKEYEIVIVDNGSDNDSYQQLQNLYGCNSKISIVSTPCNLGFAKGNNYGVKILKDKGIMNVLVVNNDVIFTQTDFLFKLANLEYDSDVGAIGTEIIGADGMNQNPINGVKVGLLPSLKSYVSKTLGFKCLLWIKKNLKKSMNEVKTLPQEQHNKIIVSNKNFFLHGSVIFFTKNYLSISDGFYSETFLFFEENILSIIFKKLNLKFMYVPTMSIYHKEDQSSKMAWANESSVKKKYSKDSIRKSFLLLICSKKRLKKKLIQSSKKM